MTLSHMTHVFIHFQANLKKLEESNQKSGQELSELNKRLIETQTTVQMLTEEKNRFEFAYNDLVHRYQELNHLAQTQTYEIGIVILDNLNSVFFLSNFDFPQKA